MKTASFISWMLKPPASGDDSQDTSGGQKKHQSRLNADYRKVKQTRLNKKKPK